MRRTSTITVALLTFVLGFYTFAWAVGNGRTLVVQLKGKGIGETRAIPPVTATGTKEGNCFDVDLFDVVADKTIGTATRCFADINTVGTGMALTETTFFRLKEGTIVSRSRTVIQPAIDGSPDVTHIAMATPESYDNTILADTGSGAFKGVPGSVRLAGVMDMRQFRERNELALDDIAVIELTNREARLQQVQKRLQAAGFYSGPIDGMPGPQTKAALRQYQAKHGLPATGELDDATRKALGVTEVPEAPDREARLQQVQKRLQVAGFYTGLVDGVPGPETRTALRQYQVKHGLPATGELDEATRRSLGVQ
jgi:peptidoglycan hydrolase-like protein with peptidoglycan-binding domain